jgi:hypothetical protein
MSKIITKSLQSGDYFRKNSSFLHIIPKTSKSCKFFSDSQNVANITNESSKLYEASLLNFVANEIVEYENFSIILHYGKFIFVLLEKVSSQPYDRVLPLPPPRPSRTPHPQSFSHAETQRQATQHGCLTRLLGDGDL